VTDPLMTAVAATITTKVIEGVSEAGKSAVEALVRLVRRKLGTTEASQMVLVRAESEPGDVARQRALAAELELAVARDRLFADELSRLWQRLTAETGGVEPVFNQVSGDVHGTVIQARDVQGGIAFGRP
jgi:hypothetical protein